MPDLVGALTADIYMVMIIAMFSARLLGHPKAARRIGLASSLILVPLVYLLVAGFLTGRDSIYYVWLLLMVLFALFELIIDDILQVDFRGVQRAVIPYVIFFFAATGGMIGVAAQAGRPWTIVTSIIFLTMAVLAFVQRKKTGL